MSTSEYDARLQDINKMWYAFVIEATEYSINSNQGSGLKLFIQQQNAW